MHCSVVQNTLYCTALYCTVLYTVQLVYCTILNTVLYCTLLYCILYVNVAHIQCNRTTLLNHQRINRIAVIYRVKQHKIQGYLYGKKWVKIDPSSFKLKQAKQPEIWVKNGTKEYKNSHYILRNSYKNRQKQIITEKIMGILLANVAA